jgi:hypothetical protein
MVTCFSFVAMKRRNKKSQKFHRKQFFIQHQICFVKLTQPAPYTSFLAFSKDYNSDKTVILENSHEYQLVENYVSVLRAPSPLLGAFYFVRYFSSNIG